MQEQLMVIMTTTLSLLTAWSWNSVLQQYIDQYYGRGLSTRLLFAVIITVITFLLVNWLLSSMKINEQDMDDVRKMELNHYIKSDQETNNK